MPQPVSNGGYYHLTGTAVGTVLIANAPANLNTYTVGTLTTGTVSLFDAAALAGTSASNLIQSYTGALRDATPMVCLKRGLVALVSGTVDAVIGIG